MTAAPTTPAAEVTGDGPSAAEPTPIVVVAYGTPAMQGSKKHVGRGIMVEASRRTRPWRETVKQAALDAMHLHDRHDGPVQIRATFAFDRPQHHYRTGRHAHLLRDTAPAWPANRGSGDLDKMLRACFDSLVDGGVMRDDAQVVRTTASKVWAGGTHPALPIPGVHLVVIAMRDPAGGA